MENLGTLDEEKKEAGDNCHKVDTAQENEDSDRNERLLVQVCWIII